jgi:hypothetical protein
MVWEGCHELCLTLVADLEDRPEYLVPFLSLVWSILRVFHLVAELQQSIFNVIEAIWRSFAVARGTNGWHLSCSQARTVEAISDSALSKI